MSKKGKKLKVAHAVPMTPHTNGMYETARELVAAERKLGIDAFIVDSRPSKKQAKLMRENAKKKNVVAKAKCPKCQTEFNISLNTEAKDIPTRVDDWTEDRGVWAAPLEQAMSSDILVSHSGIWGDLQKTSMPVIHVAHGWPRSSFLIECEGKTAIYKLYREYGKDERFKAFVSFWPEYRDYLTLLFPEEKLKIFNSFVDLDYWNTKEQEPYDFGGRKGEVNVVVADIWRTTKDPYFVMNSFMVFAKRHKDLDVKLHMYGASQKMQNGFGTLISMLEENGWRGEIAGLVKDLKTIYHSADLVCTSINSASRVVREALACGRQVVAGSNCQWTPYSAYEQDLGKFADAMDEALSDWQNDRDNHIALNRQTAVDNFDVMKTAKKFVDLFEEVKVA